MIEISSEAQAHFVKLLSSQPENTRIRVFVVNPGTPSAECGVSYCPPNSVEDSDEFFGYEDFEVVIDSDSKAFLEEAAIDYVTDKIGAQLTLKAPNARMRKVDEEAPLLDRINYIIQSDVNPQLANHGGQVSIVELTDDGFVVLQFGGGCNGCSMVDVTLKEGIEKQLLERFPDELKGVRDITEHQRGEHSYY